MNRKLKVLSKKRKAEKTPHITNGAVYSVKINGEFLRREKHAKVDLFSLPGNMSWVESKASQLLSILRRLGKIGGMGWRR